MITRAKAMALRRLIEKASVSLSDEDALSGVELYPAWAVGVAYDADERIRYEGVLYRVLQAHTSQEGWTPDTAVSLYAKVLIPGPDIPVWEQPSSTNPYMKGDKVHYPTIDDPVYVSVVDNNVWPPDQYGWELVG